MTDTEPIRRALVQKLESLRRSGVRSFPRVQLSMPTGSSTSSVKGEAVASTAARATVKESAPKPAAATAPPPAPKSPSVPGPPSPQPSTASGTGGGREPVSVDSQAFARPPMDATERGPVLEILANEVANCERCPDLVTSRRQTVFGVGNPNAKLVFFGEAPGADEDRVGEPFVGKAGQLLTKIIEACTLKREDVYIMNVLRCRPPGNRNPTPEEATNCRPFFEKQFEIIRPEFICCLGSVAATTLLQTQASVGRLRGKFHDWRGMRVVVTYHPAYLLRNAGAKKHVWADMKMLMKEMGVEL